MQHCIIEIKHNSVNLTVLCVLIYLCACVRESL